MQFGLDTLGLPQYDDLIAREIPTGWWFTSFWEEFGPAKDSIEKVLATKRPAGFRGQGLWAGSSHNYTEEHFERAMRIAREHEIIARKNPFARIEFSPFCEHNLMNPDPWLDRIARIAPTCGIINSVWKGKLSRKYKNEIHGTHSKIGGSFNYSFDGTGCVDVDITKYLTRHASAEVFYFWTYQFNGKRNGATKDDHGNPLPVIPPTQRKFWPTSELVDSIIYLRKPKGTCNLIGKRTHKSHSDQQTPKPGQRDLKPVIIVPEKVSQLEYVASNGQVIAVARYGGTYDPKPPEPVQRYRYYMPNMGYQLALKAERIQNGNPVVRLRAGGKILGTVNPAHRQNEYRD